MSAQDDAMSIIHLLTAAAQAGAKGVLSQAAFNLTKAVEAKQKAALLNNPDFQARAEELVAETKRVFVELANDKTALDEGMQDIVLFNISPESVDDKIKNAIN